MQISPLGEAFRGSLFAYSFPLSLYLASVICQVSYTAFSGLIL